MTDKRKDQQKELEELSLEELKNKRKDKEYNYSIYWVWPLNLSTILLNENDEFLNGSTIEFDDKDATGELRNQIVADMTDNPWNYFFTQVR